MNNEEVDVAGLVAITARSRPKYSSQKRSYLPGRELRAELLPQSRAKLGEQDCGISRDVIAIELVDLVTTHQRRADNSLFDKARQASTDSDFRATGRLLRHLTNSQWLACRS